MRISIVLGPFKPPPPAPSGAVEKVWWSLAEAFAARGHAVTVVGPDHPDLPRGEGWGGIAYRRMPLHGRHRLLAVDLLRDLQWSRRVRDLLPESDATITNCLFLPALLSRGSPRRRRIGLLEAHVQRFPKGQMRLYRGVDRISTVSPAVAEAIASQAPSLASRIRVVPNPVDLRLFRPAEAAAGGSGDAAGEAPLRILYTGRIHPEKGLHLLVAAAASLAAEGRRISLRLVGPFAGEAGGGGEAYRRRLESLAGEMPLSIPGPLAAPAALAEALRGCDLYCYPSTAAMGEALPVAPLEAMACGRAPVVFDLPQYRDCLADGEDATVVPRGGDESASLREALRRLADDAGLRARRDAAAARRGLRFGVEAIAEAHLADLTTSIASLRGAPSP